MVDPVHVDQVAGVASDVTLPLVVPSTARVGHVAVIMRHANITSATMNIPAGWTEQKNLLVTSNYISVLTRVLTSADLGSTVNLTMTAATKHSAVMALAANVDTTNPVAGVDAAIVTADNDGVYTAPLVTSTGRGIVYEAFFERSSTPSTGATVAGATKIAEAYGTLSAASSAVLAQDGVVNAGSVGGDTVTFNTTATVHGAVTVVLLGGAATPTGLSVSIWNGTTETPASLDGIWNGSAITPGTFGSVT